MFAVVRILPVAVRHNILVVLAALPVLCLPLHLAVEVSSPCVLFAQAQLVQQDYTLQVQKLVPVATEVCRWRDSEAEEENYGLYSCCLVFGSES
jgi:hypothetical protein